MTIAKTSIPQPVRCGWATGELSIRYHDEEWGVPVHDDRTLFEFLILEGAQAGLSWTTNLTNAITIARPSMDSIPSGSRATTAAKLSECCAIPALSVTN